MRFKYVAISVIIISSASILKGQTKDPFRLKAIDKTADYLCRFDKKENVYTPFKKNDIPNQDHITKQIEKFRTTSKTFVEFLLLKQTTFTTVATKEKLTNSKNIPFMEFVDSLIIGGLLGNDPDRRNQAKFRSLTDTLKILIKEESDTKDKTHINQTNSAEHVTPEELRALTEMDSAAMNDSSQLIRIRQAYGLKKDLDHAVKLVDPGRLRKLINDNKNSGYDSIIEPYGRILTGYDADLKVGDSMLDQHKYKEALKAYSSAQTYLQSDDVNWRINSASTFLYFSRRNAIWHLIVISILILLILAGVVFVLIKYSSYSEIIRRIEETINISKLPLEGNVRYIPTGYGASEKKRARMAQRLENILNAIRAFSKKIDGNEKTVIKLESRISSDEEAKRSDNETIDKLNKTIKDQEGNEIRTADESVQEHFPHYPRILYAIGPEEEGFPSEKLKHEKGQKTVFKITLYDETKGIFEIVEKSDYFEYALANEKYILKPACDYENSSLNGRIIKTLSVGKLIKKGEFWAIEKKALIAFY